MAPLFENILTGLQRWQVQYLEQLKFDEEEIEEREDWKKHNLIWSIHSKYICQKNL